MMIAKRDNRFVVMIKDGRVRGKTEIAGFVYNDGGRSAAGYKGLTGDCVVRAIAIATGLPYQHVYDLANEFSKRERLTKKRRKRSSARTGVGIPTSRRIMEHLGWEWVPTMMIGQGCKVHLRSDELPRGRLVVQVTHHFVAVIDGVIHDERLSLSFRRDQHFVCDGFCGD